MSPTRFMTAVGGWKTGAGIVGGVVTAAVFTIGWVMAPVQANTLTIHETRDMAIENRSLIEQQGSKIDRLICYNEEAAVQAQGGNSNFARCSR